MRNTVTENSPSQWSDRPREAAPVLVDVTRGAMTESRHRGHAIVVDPAARVVRSWGEPETLIYPRSAIKPLQAIALIESGAADAFGLDDAEIALACASHGGEPRHVQAIEAWLKRVGLGVDALACGAHWPTHDASAQALRCAGLGPSAIHNNCSGKHTAMLTTALHKGEPIEGYLAFAHPVQQRILGVLEQMCGVDLADAPRGVDGCGIPVYGLPLGNLALAFARFADPVELPDRRATATLRIARAMTAEPYMVAGGDRFCTALMTATGADIVAKVGAEGVYCAALMKLGLGVALKIEDGGVRAAEVALAAILRDLGVLDADRLAALRRWVEPTLRNRAGKIVGAIRAAASLSAQPH